MTAAGLAGPAMTAELAYLIAIKFVTKTRLDLKHRRGRLGMTDVPQPLGGQTSDCPTS